MKKNFLKIENDHNQNVNLMQSRLKRKCCWSEQLKKNDFGSREREREREGGISFSAFHTSEIFRPHRNLISRSCLLRRVPPPSSATRSAGHAGPCGPHSSVELLTRCTSQQPNFSKSQIVYFWFDKLIFT